LYSLIQSKRIRGSAGEPLPTVFKSLESAGIVFKRGQYALIAAGAGTGKSAFTLTQALKSKVPTLYFSADSDAYVQLTRSIAIMAEVSVEAANKAVLANDLGQLAGSLTDIPIRFNYDASPSLDTIETSVEAYEEVYGEYPALIVIDNITNVRIGGDGDDDPFSGLEGLNDYLHTMARETGACVVGLHHVTGPYNDAEKPIPLSGVKGQISRVPELILTLFKPEPGKIGVSAVKNRGGKADPSGNEYVELEFTGDMMRIRDVPVSAPVSYAPPADETERMMYESQPF
jgi:hypothetical protein